MKAEPWTDEEAATAVGMYRARLPVALIARRLSKSESAVRSFVRRKHAYRSLTREMGTCSIRRLGNTCDAYSGDQAGEFLGHSSGVDNS